MQNKKENEPTKVVKPTSKLPPSYKPVDASYEHLRLIQRLFSKKR